MFNATSNNISVISWCSVLLIVLIMEIGWTDVGSGGYILVSCAHSNTSWIYNYLCNQCLSPLMWVRISIREMCTTLCDKPPLFTGKLLIKFPNILRNTNQVIIRHRVKILFSIISSPITLERQSENRQKWKGSSSLHW
jgi:hypothetical protein